MEPFPDAGPLYGVETVQSAMDLLARRSLLSRVLPDVVAGVYQVIGSCAGECGRAWRGFDAVGDVLFDGVGHQLDQRIFGKCHGASEVEEADVSDEVRSST